ncbi:MAG: MltA domain-containing protein [Saprospiraceae bacterium]
MTDRPIEFLPLTEQHPDLMYKGKGRIHSKRMDYLYTPTNLATLPIPNLDADFFTALQHNEKLLDYKKGKKTKWFGNVRITHEDLERVLDILAGLDSPLPLEEQLAAYQIYGSDRRGNLKITGYYCPKIKVDSSPSADFAYPVFRRPRDWEENLPTREEIDFGLLSGQGLEIGYAEHPLDVYWLQVQGSGYAEYPSGKLELWSYDGSNRKSYRSIGKMLAKDDYYQISDISARGIRRYMDRHPEQIEEILHHNSSYTFLKKSKKRLTGAGGVNLTPQFSVAVDPKYIPLGACILAAVPVRNPKTRRIESHEYRLLFAQDTGGAIKGAGRIDVFTGIGDKAQAIADDLHHYGRLWLLLPKDISEG